MAGFTRGIAIDELGRLKITGRVKELFKTSKGKYVAPAPIENGLLASALIEQACVTGRGLAQPVALVVLAPAVRTQARDTVATALAKLREEINGTLDPHEHLDRVIVVPEEWTVDNGLLTPTMKLKRGAIEDRYGDRLQGWADGKEVIVHA